MLKSRSLRRSVLSYFSLSTLLMLSVLGSYLAYDYQKELASGLKKSLQVVAEDLAHHTREAEDVKSALQQHFHKQYQKKSYDLLFDQLTYSVGSDPEVDHNKMNVIKPITKDLTIVVSSERGVIEQKLLAFVTKLLAISFMSWLLVNAIFDLLLRRLFRPLECLVDFCKERSTQKSAVSLCSGSQEVENLKEAIVELQEANETMCEQKQDIFREAAHELKSPIAILKARLALFKQSEAVDKALFIAESEADIKTISNKLRELLFLKEIEWDMNKQKEQISMQEQCMMMQQAFRPILEKKGLDMVSNWDEDFSLYVHKEAMQKVMQAIFENIFMHTKNNSTIKNYVDVDQHRLHIVNDLGEKSDETLFSSYIGSKMIARLADKLDYVYEVEAKGGKFYTTIVFHSQ